MVKCTKQQAGFTLVELAIVMIIIGLLIGGVLKGQQLITNAQITATVAQIKAIDAATTSFKDQYAGIPGDLLNPTARIANCAAGNCANIGNGDGHVGAASIDFSNPPTGDAEQLGYWAQLNAVGLLTGIAPPAALGAASWGEYAPASKINGGGFDVGWFAGNALLSGQSNGTAANVLTGHYLALHGTPAVAAGTTAADSFMTANQANRIDTKIDDGVPDTGTVLGAGAAATACTLAGPPVAYNEAVQGAICSLYIQFQN
jgi:prepilin-type N-terminal cleavage/methylation domain-containing protein